MAWEFYQLVKCQVWYAGDKKSISLLSSPCFCWLKLMLMFWYSPPVSVRSNSSWLTRQLLEFLILFDTILDFNGRQCIFFIQASNPFRILKHSLDFIKKNPNSEIFYVWAQTALAKWLSVSQLGLITVSQIWARFPGMKAEKITDFHAIIVIPLRDNEQTT